MQGTKWMTGRKDRVDLNLDAKETFWTACTCSPRLHSTLYSFSQTWTVGGWSVGHICYKTLSWQEENMKWHSLFFTIASLTMTIQRSKPCQQLASGSSSSNHLRRITDRLSVEFNAMLCKEQVCTHGAVINSKCIYCKIPVLSNTKYPCCVKHHCKVSAEGMRAVQGVSVVQYKAYVLSSKTICSARYLCAVWYKVSAVLCSTRYLHAVCYKVFAVLCCSRYLCAVWYKVSAVLCCPRYLCAVNVRYLCGVQYKVSAVLCSARCQCPPKPVPASSLTASTMCWSTPSIIISSDCHICGQI